MGLYQTNPKMILERELFLRSLREDDEFLAKLLRHLLDVNLIKAAPQGFQEEEDEGAGGAETQR